MTPADQGLSSLGLLMQLAGSIAVAFGACVLAFPGIPPAWRVVIAALSVARALAHRAAGTRLLYADGRAGVRRYVAIAAVHTIAMAAILSVLDVPVGGIAAIAAALALWPVVLVVVMRRFTLAALPLDEDKGVEGASALMTVLSSWGLTAALALLATLLDLPSGILEMAALLLIVVVMLGVRAVLHLHAGVSGLRETSLAGAVEHVHRYASFAVVTSFVTGVALLLLGMMLRLDLATILLAGALGWMLTAWPLIIRRFMADRHFADLLADRTHHRAPDAGRAGLGWLLVGHAAVTLGFALPALVACGVATGPAELGALLTRSPLWSLGFALLEGIAGIALVRGGGRLAATAFGVAGTAIGVYLASPMLRGLAVDDLGSPVAFVRVFVAAGAIVVPAVALALVHRTVTPTAIARYR